MSFSYVFSSSCCSEGTQTELSCGMEDGNKENIPANGCCEDQICDCLCCTVVFISQPEHFLLSKPQIISSTDFQFFTAPTMSIDIGIWHPPKILL